MATVSHFHGLEEAAEILDFPNIPSQSFSNVLSDLLAQTPQAMVLAANTVNNNPRM